MVRFFPLEHVVHQEVEQVREGLRLNAFHRGLRAAAVFLHQGFSLVEGSAAPIDPTDFLDPFLRTALRTQYVQQRPPVLCTGRFLGDGKEQRRPGAQNVAPCNALVPVVLVPVLQVIEYLEGNPEIA